MTVAELRSVLADTTLDPHAEVAVRKWVWWLSAGRGGTWVGELVAAAP